MTEVATKPSPIDSNQMPPPVGSGVGRLIRAFDWRRNVTYIGFVVIFLFFAISLADEGFLTQTNQLNIIRQTAHISVMAVAMTFVLAAGHIDLSVGSVVGLSSVTTALTIRDWGLVAGLVAGVLTGVVVGTINGWLATRIGIPSFLVTLAMLGIAKGSAMWISDTAAIPILSDGYNNAFGSGDLGPVPVLAFWTLAAAIFGHIGLKKAAFGRKVLATGGNETAARYSGIDTKAMTRRVLFISSIAAAVAGMLYAGRFHSGSDEFGAGDELSVIAAAVLGGTSLFGGMGSVIGSVIGALMIGMINNGLLLMGLEFHQQLIIRGAIIILAVAAAKKPD